MTIFRKYKYTHYVDQINNSIMHLVLKFETETEHNNKSYDVIKEHKSLAENEGPVWWGKTVREGKAGSGFADKRLDTFNSQLDSNIETNAYLFENKPFKPLPEYSIFEFFTETEKDILLFS